MKFTDKPLVSVIIPFYNAEKFLTDALNSCLEQTHRPIEIICINNNSTDGSAAVPELYQKEYPGIIRLFNEFQPGAPFARNTGISKAWGEYIYFLDADDALLPNAIEILLNAMEIGIDATCGGETYYDSDLNGVSVFESLRIKNADYHVSDILYNHPNTSAVLLKKSAIKEVKWNVELKSAQELIFFIELCLRNNAKFKFVPERVCKIRIHDSSTRISNQRKKVLAYNRYQAILKIELLLEQSPFKTLLAEIALNDFKLKNAFSSINAKNFKVSGLLSARVDKKLMRKSRYFKRFSKEWVTYFTNHYVGFFFHFLGYKIVGKFFSFREKLFNILFYWLFIFLQS